MSTFVLFPLTPPPAEHCKVCHRGCRCPDGRPGCGHYGCRGTGPQDCPVATAERAAYERRLAAARAHRARLHARRAALTPGWQPPAGPL
jgi:hypothetical protein